jgi:hypothetical protein
VSGPVRASVIGPGRDGRRRVAWDIALSAVLLVVAYVAYWIATFFAFLQLSLLTPCDAATASCGTAQAGNVQFLAAVIVFLMGVIGTAGVVVLQVLRRRSWWAAAATLVLTVGGWFTASGLYQAALLR